MFQTTKDDEFFDDLPYWNVSCCIVPVTPLFTIPFQLADDANRCLPDNSLPSNIFAAINPTVMEVQLKEVKFENGRGATTPSTTANLDTEM